MKTFKCSECRIEVEAENITEIDFTICSVCGDHLCENCGKTDGQSPVCEECYYAGIENVMVAAGRGDLSQRDYNQPTY